MTFFKASGSSKRNINANIKLRQQILPPNLDLLLICYRSLYVHTFIFAKCNHVVTVFDHQRVQTTDIEPLRWLKSEWSTPLQKLLVPSVNTTLLNIDSTKSNCFCIKQIINVFFQCIFALQAMNVCWLFLSNSVREFSMSAKKHGFLSAAVSCLMELTFEKVRWLNDWLIMT